MITLIVFLVLLFAAIPFLKVKGEIGVYIITKHLLGNYFLLGMHTHTVYDDENKKVVYYLELGLGWIGILFLKVSSNKEELP